MKFFIAFILAAVCGLAMCGKAELEENLKQCAQKFSGVSMDSYKKAVSGDESAVTPDIKCMMLCVGEKMKVIKDGALQTEVLLAESQTDPAKKDIIAKMASECNLKGTDNCDSAYKITTCLSKHATMMKNGA